MKAYTPHYSSSDEVLLRLASERYVCSFRLSKPPIHGYRSSILFLEAGGREFVLKVVGLVSKSPESSEKILDLLEMLSENQIPVPDVVVSPTGERRWLADDWTAVLYHRSDGEPIGPGEGDRFREAGRTLGAIHGIPTIKLPLPDPGGEVVYKPSLLHGDYRGQNVLFEGSRVSCVLDWDEAAIGARIPDLAYGLVFFQSALVNDPPSPADMRLFLDGYETVFSLSGAERTALPEACDLALRKGLDLWHTIMHRTDDSTRRERIQIWIRGYSELSGNLDRLLW